MRHFGSILSVIHSTNPFAVCSVLGNVLGIRDTAVNETEEEEKKGPKSLLSISLDFNERQNHFTDYLNKKNNGTIDMLDNDKS